MMRWSNIRFKEDEGRIIFSAEMSSAIYNADSKWKGTTFLSYLRKMSLVVGEPRHPNGFRAWSEMFRIERVYTSLSYILGYYLDTLTWRAGHNSFAVSHLMENLSLLT